MCMINFSISDYNLMLKLIILNEKPKLIQCISNNLGKCVGKVYFKIMFFDSSNADECFYTRAFKHSTVSECLYDKYS